MAAYAWARGRERRKKAEVYTTTHSNELRGKKCPRSFTLFSENKSVRNHVDYCFVMYSKRFK
jgi:uncharacterized C2H2 Zn-finger protein